MERSKKIVQISIVGIIVNLILVAGNMADRTEVFGQFAKVKAEKSVGCLFFRNGNNEECCKGSEEGNRWYIVSD